MAKSIKLGADTYLDASGVAINNNGKTLKNFIDGYTGSYTPSFTSEGSGLSVANISVQYVLQGGVLYLSGRFNITAAPETNSSLYASLPTISGVSYSPRFSGGVGTVGNASISRPIQGSQSQEAGTIRVRPDNTLGFYFGSGNYLFPSAGTGYITFMTTIPVVITG
jgi:hypothetical protein